MLALSLWYDVALSGWCIYVVTILGLIVWLIWEIYQFGKED